MSINDFCRCCKNNLRIHGQLSNTFNIFEKNSKCECPYEKVLRLGLRLHNTSDKSFRMCRSCNNLITRLERDMPVFKKWTDDEGEQAEEACSSEASEKRERTPSETPRALREFCPNPSTPTATKTRRSITEVVTHYPSQTVAMVCLPEEASIVNSIIKKKWTTAAKLILKHKHLVEEIKVHILELISYECKHICNPNNGFILWKSSPDDLKAFSFTSLEADLKCFSPFLFSILSTVTNHSQAATCAAASIALRGREARLSAFAYYLCSILHYGGAKKAVFESLSKMAITTTHKNSVEKQKELSLLCGGSLNTLKVQNEVFPNSEAEGNIDVDQRVDITEDRSTSDPKWPLNTVRGSMRELPLSADEMAQGKTDSEIATLPFNRVSDSEAAELGLSSLAFPITHPTRQLPTTHLCLPSRPAEPRLPHHLIISPQLSDARPNIPTSNVVGGAKFSLVSRLGVTSRKRKTLFELHQKRRELAEVRDKTRVILGTSFTRWRELKVREGLQTNASVAAFLLNCFESQTEKPTAQNPLKTTSTAPDKVDKATFTCFPLEPTTASGPELKFRWSPGDEEHKPGSVQCPSCGFVLSLWLLQNGNILDEAHQPQSIEVTLEPEQPEEPVSGAEEDEEGDEESDEERSEVDLKNGEDDWMTKRKDKTGGEQSSAEADPKVKMQLCTECGEFYKKSHKCDHKEKRFPCNVCGRRFISEPALKVHSYMHSETHEYHCKFCYVSFKTKVEKVGHELIHLKQKDPFRCPHCALTFPTFRKRAAHKKEKHFDTFKCKVCGTSFADQQHFVRHVAVHTGERPFECSVCFQSFKQDSHLKSHMRLHTGERPYRCKHCPKATLKSITHRKRSGQRTEKQPSQNVESHTHVDRSGGPRGAPPRNKLIRRKLLKRRGSGEDEKGVS